MWLGVFWLILRVFPKVFVSQGKRGVRECGQCGQRLLLFARGWLFCFKTNEILLFRFVFEGFCSCFGPWPSCVSACLEKGLVCVLGWPPIPIHPPPPSPGLPAENVWNGCGPSRNPSPNTFIALGVQKDLPPTRFCLTQTFTSWGKSFLEGMFSCFSFVFVLSRHGFAWRGPRNVHATRPSSKQISPKPPLENAALAAQAARCIRGVII